MTIQFSLQDLGRFLCYVLLFVIGLLLVSLLWNTNKIIRACRKTIDKNAELFQAALLPLPGIMQNTEATSKNLLDTSEHLRVSVPPILKDAESISHIAASGAQTIHAFSQTVQIGLDDTVTTVKKDISDLMDYFHLASEIVKILLHAFSSKK